jgi:hypothetical protein
LPSELDRDRPSDAARGAGHEGCLAGELAHDAVGWLGVRFGGSY